MVHVYTGNRTCVLVCEDTGKLVAECCPELIRNGKVKEYTPTNHSWVTVSRGKVYCHSESAAKAFQKGYSLHEEKGGDIADDEKKLWYVYNCSLPRLDRNIEFIADSMEFCRSEIAIYQRDLDCIYYVAGCMDDDLKEVMFHGGAQLLLNPLTIVQNRNLVSWVYGSYSKTYTKINFTTIFEPRIFDAIKLNMLQRTYYPFQPGKKRWEKIRKHVKIRSIFWYWYSCAGERAHMANGIGKERDHNAFTNDEAMRNMIH